MSVPADDPKGRPMRLGRGLSALIGEVESFAQGQPAQGAPLETKSAGEAAANGVTELNVDLIRRNPSQPRKTFDDASLHELANSLKAKGVLQPILVRPDPRETGKYQIIAGERRFRAAKLAGFTRLPVLIRDLDELELLEIGIVENVQRTDLNAIEEAEAYEALMKRFGRTQESLAATVGKSRAHIANTLRLLQLPEEARALVRDGKVSAGHARAALGSDDAGALLNAAAEKGLSVRDVEALARSGRETLPGQVSPKAAPAAPEKDVDTLALEADLARVLGLEVDIRNGAAGGELRIKYRSLDQLDDVCRRLTGGRRSGEE
jgi:ParB family transcriptional regulator, chromosome partitioning protein